MKANLLFLALAAIMVSALSCEKGEKGEFTRNGNFTVPPLTDDNTIRFTVNANVTPHFVFVLQGGKIAVDWGDGEITKDIQPDRGEPEQSFFHHTYATGGQYRIKIWSDELTFINVIFERENSHLELAVGNCPVLETAWLGSFIQNTSLDMGNCPALEHLTFLGCTQLESVSLEGCTGLDRLHIDNNTKLASLDLSRNHNLSQLVSRDNGIEEILLPESVSYVLCSNSRLTSFVLDGHDNLGYLSLNRNPLLETLKLERCDHLYSLDISETPLANFDFSTLPKLISIVCANTGSNAIDITGNPDLQYLDAQNNALEVLDVSAQGAFESLYINHNKFGKEALNDLFTALPSAIYTRTAATRMPPPPPRPSMIAFAGNPGARGCNTEIITDKGWRIEEE
jgi:hypothetical protein